MNWCDANFSKDLNRLSIHVRLQLHCRIQSLFVFVYQPTSD